MASPRSEVVKEGAADRPSEMKPIVPELVKEELQQTPIMEPKKVKKGQKGRGAEEDPEHAQTGDRDGCGYRHQNALHPAHIGRVVEVDGPGMLGVYPPRLKARF